MITADGILLTETRKCGHGVYIPASEQAGNVSRYCSLCNPDAVCDSVLLKSMAKRKPPTGIAPEERTMDAAEYLLQSPEERITAGREFFA